MQIKLMLPNQNQGLGGSEALRITASPKRHIPRGSSRMPAWARKYHCHLRLSQRGIRKGLVQFRLT